MNDPTATIRLGHHTKRNGPTVIGSLISRGNTPVTRLSPEVKNRYERFAATYAAAFDSRPHSHLLR